MNEKSLKAANEQLMACPFCGGKARVFDHAYLMIPPNLIPPTYDIICGECGAMSSRSYNTMGEAVAAWNTRVPVPREMSAREYERILQRMEKIQPMPEELYLHGKAINHCEIDKAISIVEKWAKEHPEGGENCGQID